MKSSALFRCLVLLFLVSGYGVSTGQAQIFANGSFESGYTGWTVVGNQSIATAGTSYTATSGTKLVAFNGGNSLPNGELSQTFTTVAEQTYTLAFDAGVFAGNGASQILLVTASGGGAGSLLSQTITLNGPSGVVTRWFPQTFTFVANSATTTLKFRDQSASSNGLDLLLDNVRVTGPPTGTFSLKNDAATIHPGQKVRIPVLANDLGQINRSTLQIVSAPATGTATILPSGEILYAHSGNAPATFSYRVSSTSGQTQTASVAVTISSALRIPNNSFNVPSEPPPSAVQLNPAFPGLGYLLLPVCIASPPGDTKRLFVGEHGGKIKVIRDVTAASPTTGLLIDLAQVITTPARYPVERWNPAPGDESGLLGFAFHPNFATNGYFYVTYSVIKATDPSVRYQRLSRFTVPVSQIGLSAPVANPASEMILIEQRDRHDWHNGGDLHFGADGYLYCSTGDEGAPNDGYNNSQRIDMNFFSGIIRIDVDKKPGNLEPNSHPNPAAAGLGYGPGNAIPRDEIPAGSGKFFARYSIPVDNPYVATNKGGNWDGNFNGSKVADASLPFIRSEFWAVGLRNPWKFSIDSATGEIWAGDVGQESYEEVNLITKGGNYGWSYNEGLHAGPKSPPAGFTSAPPTYEYPHPQVAPAVDSAYKGNCVIGGVVYRGSRFASLSGAYIFGDYISGNIWAMTRSGGVPTVQRIAGQTSLTAFGKDPSNGDVLVCDYAGGRLMRLTTTTVANNFPATLSATGLFADLADLSPSPGVLPYTPNLSFWSDYAIKRRWFLMPSETSKMNWSREGSWSFPSGQIWIKHFDLESVRGNPTSSKKRIETRLLVKNENGVYGVSYRWNSAGTDATLVADAGEDVPVNIVVNGAPYTQQWRIPSRSQCSSCHTPQAGYALGFDTRQLNLSSMINGFSGNQIELLKSHGYFANNPEPAEVLPRHVRPDETNQSLEARVRSYLAVNCSYCHAGENGTAPSAWDGRPDLTLSQTGIINGESRVGGDGYKLIIPGDTSHSVILKRMIGSAGFSRMPPLGSNEIDTVNNNLVSNWINQMQPGTNTAPVAVADSYSTPQGIPLIIPSPGLLGNDTDPQFNSLTAALVASPSQGTVFLNLDGGFTYTPTAGYTGPDSFTYRANDGSLNSNIATVTLTVTGGGAVPASLVNGSFEANFDGWSYTGNQSIQNAAPYAATDGGKLIGFNGANLTPNAVLSQTFATIVGQSYTLAFDVGVLSYNTNSQTIEVAVSGNGNLLTKTVTVNGAGNGTNRWLPQSFSFVANSSASTLTFRDISAATIGLDMLLDNVRVSGSGAVVPNTAPVAAQDQYQVNQGISLVVPPPGLLANDTDSQSDPLTASLVVGPDQGTVLLNPDGGFSYTPTAGYSGSVMFTYRANDGSLNSNIATVTLTVAGGGTVPTSLVNGSFEANFDGWSYTGNQAIQNSAPYAATDGVKLVGFNSMNRTPNAVLSQTFATTAGQSYILAFDVGVLSYNSNSQSIEVAVSGNGNLLTKTITFNGLGNGTNRWLPQSFSFVANSSASTLTFRDISTSTNALDMLLDNVRVSGGGTVAPNTAPMAAPDQYLVNQGIPLVVPPPGLLANDTDSQSNPLTASLAVGPDQGTVALDPNGGFTYTPTASYTGPVSFTYRANDGSLNSNIATVTLTVKGGGTVPASLVNGSFESDYIGWTWSGNQQIRPNSSTYKATDGVKYIGFNGGNSSPNGVLSQTFATTPSQSYRLEFDAGVLAFNTSPQSLRVTATGASSLLSQVVTVVGLSSGGVRWLPQSFTFVADSASTTLTFRDQSSSTNSIDLLLDNVRVADIYAAPSKFAADSPALEISSAALAVIPEPENLGTPTLTGKPGDLTISMNVFREGNYILEFSEDLIHWERGGEKEMSEPGLIEFHDVARPLEPPKLKRFYRIFRTVFGTSDR